MGKLGAIICIYFPNGRVFGAMQWQLFKSVPKNMEQREKFKTHSIPDVFVPTFSKSFFLPAVVLDCQTPVAAKPGWGGHQLEVGGKSCL